MSARVEFAVRATMIGAGATLAMDLWAWSLRLLGMRGLDMGLLGRWIGHLPRGRFRHDTIAEAAPVAGELAIGIGAHYMIGIAFAFVFLAISGIEWARQPTLFPALVFGFVTVAAPFLILQPGFGAGVAASNLPSPDTVRVKSLLAHLAYGVGLYAAARAAAAPARAMGVS